MLHQSYSCTETAYGCHFTILLRRIYDKNDNVEIIAMSVPERLQDFEVDALEDLLRSIEFNEEHDEDAVIR